LTTSKSGVLGKSVKQRLKEVLQINLTLDTMMIKEIISFK